MEKMRFHWEKESKTGNFIVTAYSVEECMKIAEKEILKAGAEMTDWYSI